MLEQRFQLVENELGAQMPNHHVPLSQQAVLTFYEELSL